jgi:uncharacterized protein (DUF305 family)
MKNINIYAAAGVTVSMFIVGIGVGYMLTPEYRTTMYDRFTMDLGPADRSFDLRYINAMIAHHRGAMLLAEQLAASPREEMRLLSADILKAEPVLIDELYTWKKNWYGDVRPVRDPLVAKLGNSDEHFDLRFLNAMIAHHEVGVIMADETKTKTSRTEVLNNANAVGAFLSQGIVTLQSLRKNWYGI